MILSRTTPCQIFEIRQPRWKDRMVLLAKYKVGSHNQIVFTQAKSLPDTYYVSGAEVAKCKVGTNGTIPVYEVPLSKLELLERE